MYPAVTYFNGRGGLYDAEKIVSARTTYVIENCEIKKHKNGRPIRRWSDKELCEHYGISIGDLRRLTKDLREPDYMRKMVNWVMKSNKKK